MGNAVPNSRPFRLTALAIAAGSLAAAPLVAKEPKIEAPKPPQLYQQVLDCKAIADPAARLACYDAKVEALADATAKREVVITDKAEIRKTKRGLFGFSLPIGRLFGGGDEDEADKAEAEEAKRLDTVVESARLSRDGMMLLTFKEGGTWEQTDSRTGFAVKPKAGEKATITKGMGSGYFVKVEGQPGVKMRRVQ